MTEKKYTRREAIKYGVKIGGGAALWGTVGNIGGRIYESVRDFYDDNLKPAVDKVGETREKIGDFGEKVYDFFRPKDAQENTSEKKQEKREISRRGFIKKITGAAHRHPKTAGTVVGVMYGGTKYSLSNASRYLDKKKIAELKDENVDYERRLEILEEYKKELEEDLEEKDSKIYGLESDLKKVGEMIESTRKEEGGLEKITGEIEDGINPLLVIGGIGVLVSLLSSSMIITGNYIGGVSSNEINILTIFVFIISLILIFLGRGRGDF